MAQTGTKVAGGLLASALAVGVAAARDLGPFADDVARAGAHIHIPPNAIDALTDPDVKFAIKQAISTIRSMAKGDPQEKVVASAACATMNHIADNGAGHEEFKAQIMQRVRGQNILITKAVERYADKAADALMVANTNGGTARWYFQYCLRP